MELNSNSVRENYKKLLLLSGNKKKSLADQRPYRFNVETIQVFGKNVRQVCKAYKQFPAVNPRYNL